MFRAVRFLVRHNYREVVVLSSHEWEEPCGLQHSHEETELAARDSNGLPFRIRHEAEDAKEGWITRAEPLEESVFGQLFATNVRQDTPTFYDTLEGIDRLAAERSERQQMAQRRFDQLRPNCPKCQSPMVLRKSNQGNQFWGCANYAACNGERGVSQPDLGIIQKLYKDGAG